MTTALSKNNLQQSIKIYPNPVTGKVTIECGNCSESLKLLNSIGQEVMEITLKSAKEIVDLSALNKGVYFLVYSQQKLRIVTKVVVQ
jgi:hypothetical protein